MHCSGDDKKAIQCATIGSTLAKSLVIQTEKRKMHEVVAIAKSAQLGVLAMTNPDVGATFEVPKETKKIPIDPEFPERKAIIGAGLDEK